MDVFWFNDKRIEAMHTGIYECPECGQDMEFEDPGETILVCPRCGNSMLLEEYGEDD